MQLTAILLTVCCLSVTARTVSQSVTYSGKDVKLETLFEEIKKQTGYFVFFEEDLVKKGKLVDVEAKDMPLKDFLDVILVGQPFSYSLKKTTITIERTRKKDLKILSIFQQADAPPVTGIVRGPDGQPLAGVNITVKGTKRGVSTGADGKFSIEAGYGDVLVISSVGYGSKEISVSGDNNLLVRLEMSTSPLDEVQIIAYGSTSRRLNTGNTYSIKSTEIEKQPVTNPLLALQGRIPGLMINQSTGFANAGVTVRIQGTNSIDRGSDPLYIVDGVPFPSQMIRSNTVPNPLGESGSGFDGFGAGYGNPLSFINPASIESIDILKDADATAIYGSRAANGAILITTKKGKAGSTKFDATFQNGVGQVARKLDLLKTEQYLDMRKEAFQNDGLNIPTPASPLSAFNLNNYDLTVWDQNRYTNWQEELIGGSAKYTDVQTTISGGTVGTQFLIGGGYHRETTVFPGDFANNKASLHFSINNVAADQRFRIQLTGDYMVDDNNVSGYDLTREAMMLPPNAPALYNSEGTLNWAPAPNGASTWRQPLAFLERTYSAKTSNLLGNAVLSYQLLPGLEVKNTLGYTNLTTEEFGRTPLTFYAPELRASNERKSSFANSKINTWIIEPQLTYKHNFGKGKLDGLLGGSIQQKTAKSLEVQGDGYSNDLLMGDLRSATVIREKFSPSSIYKYNALFARVGYNLLDKYLFNVTLRRDASSRFGPQKRLHNFGSVAGAWIISEEGLVKNHISFLSFAKIRVSYGTTGNDQIGDYQYLNEYSAIDVPVAYQGIPSIAPNGIPNPGLAWEETKKLQGGLDFGVFEDRILFSAGYYRNRSSNQLLGYNLPLVAGFGTISVVNFPATVQNDGWEFSLNTINIKNEKITWSSSLNLTLGKNKLIAFQNLESSSYANILIINESIRINKRYLYLGVNPTTGLYEIGDKNGKPTTTPDFLADRTQLIDPTPKFGGFQNDINYKGLQLSFFLQFVKQIGPSYQGDRPGVLFTGSAASGGGNQPVSVLDRWQNPGDLSTYQRFSTYNGPPSIAGRDARTAWRQATDTRQFAYEDASYIRLKNVALSWDLPQTWIKPARFKYVKLLLQAQNVLTFTKYSGLDPETLSSLTLPPLRVLTLGVKFGL